jgi:hypothetical protein
MDWKRERDALIAQTYAFVQSVAWKLEQGAREPARETSKETLPQKLTLLPLTSLPPLTSLQPLPEARATPAEAAPTEPVAAVAPRPTPLVLPSFDGEVKDEIGARIANFRAHQERFNRERAEYFSATLARVRSALREVPPPRPGGNHPGARRT